MTRDELDGLAKVKPSADTLDTDSGDLDASEQIQSQQAESSESQSEGESSVDFETALGEIEKIVGALESGELTLDDSLTQYETAVAKMRQCYRLLEVAERKISILAGFDAEGNPISESFDDGGGNRSDSDSLIAKQKNRGRRRGVGASDLADASQDED